MDLIGTNLCYQRLTEFRSDYQAYTEAKCCFGEAGDAPSSAVVDEAVARIGAEWATVGLGLGVSLDGLRGARSTKPAAAAPRAPLRPQDPGRSICGTLQTSSAPFPEKYLSRDNLTQYPPKKILSPSENSSPAENRNA